MPVAHVVLTAAHTAVPGRVARHHTITTPSPSSQHHHNTIITTPSSQHHHHNTITSSL
jgi:hypothetical protein